MISKFKLGDTLGSGGFGVVREAKRLAPDGSVAEEGLAVKLLAEHHLQDEDAVSRFRREVTLLERGLDHPHIIEVVATDLEAVPPFFVMPRAESNLDRALRGGRAGDGEWIVPVFTSILEGMAHAHERETPILHRDLKPLNILFVQGVPKITDFGLGKALDPDGTRLTSTGLPLGTDRYMAPEQIHDTKNVAAPADVYALGKILWAMLTGEEPEVLHVEISKIPDRYRYFIDRCCQWRPADRFASAAEALEAFKRQMVSPRTIEPPLEGAESILARWPVAPDAGARSQVVAELDEHLQRNASEFELYFQVVPRLPRELVDSYMSQRPATFASTLRIYDRHVSGSLPFTYCDVLADFYRRVFAATEDLEMKRLTLARLFEVGAAHNRWYVGDVVADLLAGVRDISTAMLVAEVVERQREFARWYWDPWLKDRSLIAPIREAYDLILAAPDT